MCARGDLIDRDGRVPDLREGHLREVDGAEEKGVIRARQRRVAVERGDEGVALLLQRPERRVQSVALNQQFVVLRLEVVVDGD